MRICEEYDAAELLPGFDPKLNLWTIAMPGHTPETSGCHRTHPGRFAAEHLLVSAELDMLDHWPVGDILDAIAALQVHDGEHAGNFRWHVEEQSIHDTNAGFFTMLPLLLLRAEHPDKLDDASRLKIEQMSHHARPWFVRSEREGKRFYPNKYLGDLVCLWLIEEAVNPDGPPSQLVETMTTTAAYLRDNGWGWGEHLSDNYVGVCLSELAALHFAARHMPQALAAAFDQLWSDLMELERFFDAQPRVPALRQYAFVQPPYNPGWLELLRNLDDPAYVRSACQDLSEYKTQLAMALLARRREPSLARPIKQSPERTRRIRCYDGTEAISTIAGDDRLGSVSRFPVMPNAEHHDWGLGWQCMPIALWSRHGHWGFMQWQTKIGDRIAAHPAAVDRTQTSGPMIPKSLNINTRPPIVGQTFAVQRSRRMAVLRLMPAIAMEWDMATDRWRQWGKQVRVISHNDEATYAHLNLELGQTSLNLCYVDLNDLGRPVLETGEGRLDWSLNVDRRQLEQRELIMSLWMIGLCKEPGRPESMQTVAPPDDINRHPEQRVWRMTWAWPDEKWDLTIDPLAANPLRLHQK